MKKTSDLLCLAMLFLIFACAESGVSVKSLEGLWIMDSGISEYIGIAAFEIRNTDKGFQIFLGEIENGKLVEREKPASIVKTGKEFVVKISDASTIKLISDEKGLKLIGISGANEGSPFHFKKK
jgi:hypothetical protein